MSSSEAAFYYPPNKRPIARIAAVLKRSLQKIHRSLMLRGTTSVKNFRKLNFFLLHFLLVYSLKNNIKFQDFFSDSVYVITYCSGYTGFVNNHKSIRNHIYRYVWEVNNASNFSYIVYYVYRFTTMYNQYFYF